MSSFLPVGWSPSGRYFAVIDDSGWSSPDETVVMFDSRDGTAVASYHVALDSAGAGGEELDGASWQADGDVLWVAESSSDDRDYSVVSAVALRPDGSTARLRSVPSTWKQAYNPALVLGADGSGVLVLLEGENASMEQVWKLSGASTTLVDQFPDDEFDFSMDVRNAYEPGQGLLTQTYSGSGTGSGHAVASVIALDGTGARAIWPAK
jgi:hypothetical protein